MHTFGAVLLVALLLQTTTTTPPVHGQVTPRLVAEWRFMEYEFPNATEQQRATDDGEYVANSGVPIDMDIDYGSTNQRIFVTVPRFVTGIPITLGTLTTGSGTGGPRIRAYPDYDWNQVNTSTNCLGLTSVFRVQIDDCRRLWVLDSGRVGGTHYCPPQMVVFDLDTDQVVQQYTFPSDQYITNVSQLNAFVIDGRDATPGTPTTCPNYRAYIADVVGFGVMMYDYATNTSWRALSKWLYSTPAFGTYTIAGESFDLMDGIFTLALGARMGGRSHHGHKQKPRPSSSGGDCVPVAPSAEPPTERVMYWHSLASTWENRVPVSVLDNSALWNVNSTIMTAARSFRVAGDRGCQATAEVADNNANIFMGLVNPIGIACWDTQRPYARNTMRVVWQNDTTLQFPSGLKVKRNPGTARDELWAFSIRMQKFYANSYSPNEVNFRIQVADVAQLLNGGTRCSDAVGAPLPAGNLVGQLV